MVNQIKVNIVDQGLKSQYQYWYQLLAFGVISEILVIVSRSSTQYRHQYGCIGNIGIGHAYSDDISNLAIKS